MTDIRSAGLALGGGGTELVGKEPKHTFYHYVRVTVNQDQVSTEVVKIDKAVKYSGLKRYASIAGIYVQSLGKIYVKYVLIGFFLLVLIFDGLLEYLYQKKQRIAKRNTQIDG